MSDINESAIGEDYYENWEETLKLNGYRSLIPVREYFSTDMTEAWIMADMWINLGTIVKIEEEL